MPSQSANSGRGITPTRYPLLLTVFSGLSFVFLLLLYYVGTSFETLEDQLRFQSPAIGQRGANGAYGIEIVDGQTVYVPVYSHIYADGGRPASAGSDPDYSKPGSESFDFHQVGQIF